MKEWKIKVKSQPTGIIKKLDAAFGSGGGFVFNTGNDKDDTVLFKIRKRIKFPFQILQNNSIVVKGKLLKTESENETGLRISFAQHFLIVYAITEAILLVLGLIAISPGFNNSASIYILGAILLVIGVVSWFAFQKKTIRDIQKYKKLISEILEC